MSKVFAEFIAFDDRATANAELAKQIEDDLNQAILKRNAASFWLSGGGTPSELYRKIGKSNLDWQKILVSLVDERYVPPTDEASNEQLVKSTLLSGPADQADFVPFYQLVGTPEENQRQLEKVLREKIHGALDVVVLGMGNDGHTASLFPCASETEAVVSATNDQYTAVTRPTSAPHARITLTLNRLLASRSIYLLLFGEEKLATLRKAEQGDDELAMPIRYFLFNETPKLKVFWAP